MKVLKFGSATIESIDKFKNVASISMQDNNNIIVLSSMRGTPEALMDIAGYLYKANKEAAIEKMNQLENDYFDFIKQIFTLDKTITVAHEYVKQIFDFIRSLSDNLFTLFEERVMLAQGELLSSALFQWYLQELNCEVILIPALEVMRTDKNMLPDSAFLKSQISTFLKPDFKGLYLTQGYICRNAYGEIDDLRKGGNDYTACLIANVVGATEVQIWADEDILCNNDPRSVADARPVAQLNFDEAAELTYFGTKILHPNSILPAKLADIPVRLKNIQYPDKPGTVISNRTEPNTIKAVAAKDHITVINIKSGNMLLAHGYLRRIFEIFENYRTPIDMLATSEIGVSLSIDNNHYLENIVEELKKYGSVSFSKDMVIIAVIGDLNNRSSYASVIMDAVSKIPVKMISYGGTDYHFSFLIDREHKETALNILNAKLFD